MHYSLHFLEYRGINLWLMDLSSLRSGVQLCPISPHSADKGRTIGYLFSQPKTAIRGKGELAACAKAALPILKFRSQKRAE
jgi:hypothetical protein